MIGDCSRYSGDSHRKLEPSFVQNKDSYHGVAIWLAEHTCKLTPPTVQNFSLENTVSGRNKPVRHESQSFDGDYQGGGDAKLGWRAQGKVGRASGRQRHNGAPARFAQADAGENEFG